MTSPYDTGRETDPQQTAYTVTAVSEYLKATLESDPRLADLIVVGEVSGYRNPSSGHHYFSLRDKKSVLRGVMFRSGRGGETRPRQPSRSIHLLINRPDFLNGPEVSIECSSYYLIGHGVEILCR